MKKLNIKGLKKPSGNLFKSRRFKYGSMATVMTVLFVVVVVILNIITSLILDRLPTNIDLTSDKIFELTEESIEFAKEIDTDVTITVCKKESDLSANTYANQANQIIKNYAKYSNKVKVDYVELLEDPTFASKYSEYGITDYSIVVESAKRTKVFSMLEMFDIDYDETTYEQSTSSNAEQVMTSALMYVTDEDVFKAVVLNGHSEVEAPALTSMLKDNNYEIVNRNIETEEIDTDAAIAVIYAPTTDYTKDEIRKLSAFLDNDGQFGKTVVYVASYEQPADGLPNLEGFLLEWGIEIGNSVIAETDTANIYNQTPYFFAANFADNDYNVYDDDLRDSSLPYLAYYTRPISLAFDAAGNRTAYLLLESSENSVLVPMGATEFDWEKADKDSHGVAAVGYRRRYDGTVKYDSNVIAFGGTGLFDENLTSNSRYNNNEYSINVINKLSGKEQSLNIVAVSFDAEQLTPTEAVVNNIQLVFVVAIPLVTLALGVVVWVRRRHK